MLDTLVTCDCRYRQERLGAKALERKYFRNACQIRTLRVRYQVSWCDIDPENG